MREGTEKELKVGYCLMNKHNGNLAKITEEKISDFGDRTLSFYKVADNYTTNSWSLRQIAENWFIMSPDEYELLLALSDTTTRQWGREYGVVPAPLFTFIVDIYEANEPSVTIDKMLFVECADQIMRDYCPFDEGQDGTEIKLCIAELPYKSSKEQMDELVFPPVDENGIIAEAIFGMTAGDALEEMQKATEEFFDDIDKIFADKDDLKVTSESEE